MNISSAVIHARPGAAGSLRARLEAIAGVEIHAADDSRLIVTIEADDDRATADIFESLGRLAGVLSVAMVYHRTEDDPEACLA
ncbi:MAG TPA: chaperone NapD [Rhodocyclaceae bacterium]